MLRTFRTLHEFPMKLRSTLAAACASLALALPAAAGAAVRHVDTTGVDGANSCLVATAPCRTITHAMGQASPGAGAGDGDTVSVGPGVYGLGTGEIFPIALKSGVKLVAAAVGKPDGTVIDGAGSTMGILEVRGNTAAGTRIEGFTLRSGVTLRSQPGRFDLTAIGGAIRVIDSPSGTLTITRNILRDNAVLGEPADGGIRYNGGGGRALGGAIGVADASVIITNNLFIANAARGGKGYDHPTTPFLGSRENGGRAEGGAIGLLGATGAIVNNTFESNLAFGGDPGNATNGTGFPGPTMGGAVRVLDSNARVVNNVFARNHSAVSSRSSTFAIAGALRVDPAGIEPDANLHFGSRVNESPSTAGDTFGIRYVLADPQFVASADWHIGALSPAVGAGSADVAAPIDMEGLVRRNPPSIGAYEYIDNLPPETHITSAPSGSITARSALIAFSSPETLASFECSLDGATFVACLSPWSITGLPDGGHTFRVRARDPWANLDATPALAAWTIVPPSAAMGVEYNELRQKSSHNSYQRDEAVLDQLVFHRIRSLEFDIHNGKSGWSKRSGDWYVYHADVFDADTTCHRLSDCLDELRAFHVANPNHEVVTVFIDLKDDFEAGRSPEQLDALIASRLPPQWLLRPEDLFTACPGAATLKAAVTGTCRWPTHLQLRGRFVFALTGSDLNFGTKLSGYASNDPVARSRHAFVAPDLTSASGIATAKTHAVFFNIKASNAAIVDAVHAAGFVGRVWDVNSASTWSDVALRNVNHIGTDKVSHLADPWARTHNTLGWPFQCLHGLDCTQVREPSQLYGISATSGDIWGNTDSFVFAHQITFENAVGWNAAVATPNSHVDEWGKGCLMARASLAPNAAYAAMCRTADRHKLRMQYRSTAGASTSMVEVDIVATDTIDQESLSFIALDVIYDGSRTRVNAYGSQNKETWRLIHTVTLAGRLPYQGLAMSSHGSGAMKMLFTDLRRNEQAYAGFPVVAAVGTGASGWAFDGFGP